MLFLRPRPSSLSSSEDSTRAKAILCYALGTILFAGAAGIWLGAHETKRTAKATRDEPITEMRDLPKVKPLHRLRESKWALRHAKINRRARQGNVDLLFLGDSITQGFETKEAWRRYYGHRKAMNAGIWSDRVEHLLWRVQNGNLEGIRPKVAVVLIGINNLAVSSPIAIAGGVQQILQEIHRRSPETKILLLGLLPSGKSANHSRRPRIARVNRELSTLADGHRVVYRDIGGRFLSADLSLSPDIMPDALHPSSAGYEIFAQAIEPDLRRMLGESIKTAQRR